MKFVLKSILILLVIVVSASYANASECLIKINGIEMPVDVKTIFHVSLNRHWKSTYMNIYLNNGDQIKIGLPSYLEAKNSKKKIQQVKEACGIV